MTDWKKMAAEQTAAEMARDMELKVPVTNEALERAMREMGGDVMEFNGAGKKAVSYIMQRIGSVPTLTLDTSHKDGTFMSLTALVAFREQRNNQEFDFAAMGLTDRERYRYMAAAIMMPRDTLISAVTRSVNQGDALFEEMAKHFNVTPEIAYRRIDGLGIQ